MCVFGAQCTTAVRTFGEDREAVGALEDGCDLFTLIEDFGHGSIVVS
jgi:hypothetical protein